MSLPSPTTVTNTRRAQVRRAVEAFLQAILGDPANAAWHRRHAHADATPQILWREGLIFLYRLLFILKLECAPDPARSTGFTATDSWQRACSPSVALAPLVREILDLRADTRGRLA